MKYNHVNTILILSIISLVVFTQLIIWQSINSNAQDARLVNIAGRQRMLSQNISKVTLKIAAHTTDTLPIIPLQKELQNLANKWQEAHKTLTQGNDALGILPPSSSAIQQLFQSINPEYDSIATNALLLSKITDRAKIPVFSVPILANEALFLSKMEAIVLQYETEINAKNTKLQRLQIFAAIAILLILLLEVLFFVRPVLSKLNEKNEALKVANQALLASKNKAEEAVDVKSTFLSNMTHEIRTPLNGIVGISNLLAQENPREDQLEHLDTLLFSAENLLVIINDILDYSKIEAERIKFEKIPFSLKNITHRIYKTLKSKIDEKNIAFEIAIDDAVPSVVIGDPVRLSQVLTNLANNAIKFTDKGGKVMLKIELKQLNKDKTATLHFSVIDTGIGIAADKQAIIFENFSQASSDTTRKYGGTGLGLAITKKLLALQGSEIKVNSTLGEGATFYFDLIYAIGSLNAIEKTAVEQIQTNAKIQSFAASNHVLLVEDNKINILIAKRFLEKWNLVVDVAHNGCEAVKMVQQNAYGLVLMDINMPEMDGYEATKQIRSLEQGKFKTLPIVALTASIFEEFKQDAIDAGMNDYVCKPFKPQELYDVIAKYIPPFTASVKH